MRLHLSALALFGAAAMLLTSAPVHAQDQWGTIEGTSPSPVRTLRPRWRRPT